MTFLKRKAPKMCNILKERDETPKGRAPQRTVHYSYRERKNTIKERYQKTRKIPKDRKIIS